MCRIHACSELTGLAARPDGRHARFNTHAVIYGARPTCICWDPLQIACPINVVSEQRYSAVGPICTETMSPNILWTIRSAVRSEIK
jgi:hypothetical protein